MSRNRIFHFIVFIVAAFALMFIRSEQPVAAQVSPPITITTTVPSITHVDGYWGPDIPVVLTVHVYTYVKCFCFVGGHIDLKYQSTTGPKTRTQSIGPSGQVVFNVPKSELNIGTLFTAYYSGNIDFAPSSGTIYVYFDPAYN